MNSPTLELISKQRTGVAMPNEREQSEMDRLQTENMNLRRKLAMLTAQYVWTEGGSLAKINEQIREYGFRLQKMDSGHDPKIVPITKVADATGKEVSADTGTPVVEKRAGKYDTNWGRA